MISLGVETIQECLQIYLNQFQRCMGNILIDVIIPHVYYVTLIRHIYRLYTAAETRDVLQVRRKRNVLLKSFTLKPLCTNPMNFQILFTSIMRTTFFCSSYVQVNLINRLYGATKTTTLEQQNNVNTVTVIII